MKDVQLEMGGPPGQGSLAVSRRAAGWRAVTRVLRSSGGFGKQTVKQAGGAVWTSVSDLASVVMPSECRLCGGAMGRLGTVRVCEACLARVGAETAERDETVCARCGDAMGMREASWLEDARFAAAMGVRACTMCRLAPPEFERAVASGDYDDEMREMLHLLKFAGRRALAELVLGERVARAAMMLCDEAAKELVVVPVPLFAARERERGYNQALLLARAAVKRLKKATPEWRLRIESGVLVRVKNTRPLYFMASPKERRASLRGAFRVVKSEALRGREVLLVDDIMTTRATARECARVLMRAGAAKVWVATAAKVQPESARSEQMEPVEVAMWSPKLVEPDVSRQRRFGGSDG
ncbi:hypothetical protein GOB94_04765 [Granulicella sp. 5B5]|uniref:ComF family protein n=1 Tax=Granulicella sp. 5B5 TaxID=1617967 RepID=UPI0015F3D9E3|nr:ComF family protein [Granulicella sp. 5B5]QMV18079.1 hypothetical protein GOB94_04765 [Granulicella sp. 5B5]